MKITTPLAAMLLSFAVHASAQSSASSTPFKPAPPPPSMSDPGVKATPVLPSRSDDSRTTSTPAEMSPTRMPGKPIPLPRRPGDKGPAQATPDVEVRQEGDQTVQEYRQGGRLYMVVVTPKHGVPQTYMVDEGGKLHNSNGGPPVQPVMYNLFEWGKSHPPPDPQGGASDDNAN